MKTKDTVGKDREIRFKKYPPLTVEERIPLDRENKTIQGNKYSQGQIDMFNRLWNVATRTEDPIESSMLLFKELNKIRKELTHD